MCKNVFFCDNNDDVCGNLSLHHHDVYSTAITYYTSKGVLLYCDTTQRILRVWSDIWMASSRHPLVYKMTRETQSVVDSRVATVAVHCAAHDVLNGPFILSWGWVYARTRPLIVTRKRKHS